MRGILFRRHELLRVSVCGCGIVKSCFTVTLREKSFGRGLMYEPLPSFTLLLSLSRKSHTSSSLHFPIRVCGGLLRSFYGSEGGGNEKLYAHTFIYTHTLTNTHTYRVSKIDKEKFTFMLC
jgi:hypothetical protein